MFRFVVSGDQWLNHIAGIVKKSGIYAGAKPSRRHGLMVRASASYAGRHRFDSWSGQTKDFKIGIHSFPA